MMGDANGAGDCGFERVKGVLLSDHVDEPALMSCSSSNSSSAALLRSLVLKVINLSWLSAIRKSEKMRLDSQESILVVLQTDG